MPLRPRDGGGGGTAMPKAGDCVQRWRYILYMLLMSAEPIDEKRLYKVLPKVNYPEDIKRLSEDELEVLCVETRDFLIRSISRTGGHFGASLGTVELTVALHRIFDSPSDKFIWDVGHQAYVHKMFTGRRSRFPTLRQYKGLSGFCRRHESEYDAFGAGHASTSISAGMGMIVGRDQFKKNHHIISIIGDGALTGGLAFEALNNAGWLKKDIIIILNDNNMSIDHPVGSISHYVSKILIEPRVYHLRQQIERSLKNAFGNRIFELTKKLEKNIKGLISDTNFFHDLGCAYVGPIDGHNLQETMKSLQYAREATGPVVVHVKTVKGKGYDLAEKQPIKYHGVVTFDPDTGAFKKKEGGGPGWPKIFAAKIIEIAKRNPKVVAITPAMPTGSGLTEFAKVFPDRFYDVGIAEAHAVCFSAGLATEGVIPICAIYSTFLQRAFDQIIHDVALQNLKVIFCIDRAGIVGGDGETHQGLYDLGYLRIIPNMTICAPRDNIELEAMLDFLVDEVPGPSALRYPRGECIMRPANLPQKDKIELGKGEILREGKDVTILAYGTFVYDALKVAESLQEKGLRVGVANARFLKPIDKELIQHLCDTSGHIVILEEGLSGGLGAAVLEAMSEMGILKKTLLLHLPDKFYEHGDRGSIMRDHELSPEKIEERILKFAGAPVRV